MTTTKTGMGIFNLLASCERLGSQVTSNDVPADYVLNMLDVKAIQNGSMPLLSVLEPMDSTYSSIRPLASRNIESLGFAQCSFSQVRSGKNAACTAETGSDRWIKITPEFVSWLEDRERTARVGTNDVQSLQKRYEEKADKFSRDYYSLVAAQKQMMTTDEKKEFQEYINLKSNREFLDRLLYFHPTIVEKKLTPESVQCGEIINNDNNHRRCSRPHAENSVYCTQHRKIRLRKDRRK
jgi:hypothetical protein